MPRYDLECPRCGVDEEVLRMDEPVPACPECGSARKKVFGSLLFSPKVAADVPPRYRHWMETEGKRRMSLPSGHPEKLEPASKSADVMHI